MAMSKKHDTSSTPLLGVGTSRTSYNTQDPLDYVDPEAASPSRRGSKISIGQSPRYGSTESFKSFFRSGKNTPLTSRLGEGYTVTAKDLADMHSERNEAKLKELGGVVGVARAIKSDPRKGIRGNDVEIRYERFGRNVYPEPPVKSFWEHFKDGLDDTTVKILMGAGVLSLIFELALAEDSEERSKGWIEGFAILLAVLCVGLVTAWNNYSKERQFRALNSVKNNRTIKVIRGGVQSEISIYDIAVGDVVSLDTGDHIPADGLYIQGFGLEADESVMTGESETVKKSNEHPFMLSGCQVAQGIGSMLVTGVGINSEWGRTLSMLVEEQEETPLQQKLADLAEQIGKVGLAFATLTYAVLVIRWIVDVADDFEASDLLDLLDFFLIAVTIVVVAVPEGLPLAVTISLAYSMKRMQDQNNLVRHLEACETMGGATNICSDKTGTLTENRMTVVQMWFSGHKYDTVPQVESVPEEFAHLFMEAVSTNSNANIRVLPNGKIEYIGNKTECALLLQCASWNGDYLKIRESAQVEQFYAFSSERKRMSVLLASDNGKRRLYTKGASEMVLELCSTYVADNGKIRELNEELRQNITKVIDSMANQALRTICIAYADITTEEVDPKEAPEQNLTLIALVGIQDPVRPEVPAAVESCKRAGIFVRMVTGDNIATAKAIARQCGILTDGIAMEGPQFRKLTPAQMDDVIPRLQVLARSSPTDKHTLVKRLRHLGEVVGVTGDGTNDAPALKEADVGMAMGISGTDVAKEASDMIIMDDNFTSIVNAVTWGRCVFNNIRKFLQFQLTVNVVALVLAFIGGVAGEKPLTTVQLLWVNLLMDSWGALALGTELPTPDLLDRKPYGRYEALISPKMYRHILGQALVQLSVLLVIFFFGCDIFYDGDDCKCGGERDDDFQDECKAEGNEMADSSGTTSEQYTLIFNVFVFMQIFNEINSRRIDDKANIFSGIFQSPFFFVIIALTVIIQAAIVQFGGEFTQTVPLDSRDWIVSVVGGFLMIPTGYIFRKIPLDRFIQEHFLNDNKADKTTQTIWEDPTAIEF